jgi:hypothetical protein
VIAQLLLGCLLIASNVAVHTALMACLLAHRRAAPSPSAHFRGIVGAPTPLAVGCELAHLLEIGIWAAFFAWRGVMPDFEVAAYFSAVTYATIGYGDVTPPADWRLLAAMEGLTGILLCAWSGGLVFAAVQRLLPAPETAR